MRLVIIFEIIFDGSLMYLSIIAIRQIFSNV